MVGPGSSQVSSHSGRLRSEPALSWALSLLTSKTEADSQVRDYSGLALEVGNGDSKYPYFTLHSHEDQMKSCVWKRHILLHLWKGQWLSWCHQDVRYSLKWVSPSKPGKQLLIFFMTRSFPFCFCPQTKMLRFCMGKNALWRLVDTPKYLKVATSSEARTLLYQRWNSGNLTLEWRLMRGDGEGRVWRGWQRALAQGGVCYLKTSGAPGCLLWRHNAALCQPLITVITAVKTVWKLGLQLFNALGHGLGTPEGGRVGELDNSLYFDPRQS